MILEKQKEANILTEGVSQGSIGMSLDLDSAQVLMQMLSKNLYSDSIGSTIRECASNALDSHRRAGVDKPIIVSFKTNNSNNYEFSVEDFGTGLDASDVENIISKYGKSTKRNSNTELGMMGLGFKAPLAYSSSFYFTCRKDGMERKYMMYEGEDVNTIDLLYEMNTSEENGVKVTIPVKYSDRREFIEKTREQLAYFENVYFDFENDAIVNDFVIFRNSDFQFSEMATDRKMHLSLDNVYYPLDFQKLGIEALYFPVALRFSLTDGIFPTPNREALRYTQESKQIILDKIKTVANYFVNKYNESVEESDNIYQMVDFLSSSTRSLSLFNNSYNINLMKSFSDVAVKEPTLIGVEKLDLKRLYTNKDYWLSGYSPKFKINYRGAAINLEKRYTHDWRVGELKNVEVYYYTNKLPGIKKEYIKQITSNNKSSIIVRKGRDFVLGMDKHKVLGYSNNYYNILGLSNYPKSEWRQLIKEFIYILSLFEKDFINVDEMVVPQYFIDSRKRIKIRSSVTDGDGKRKKLSGEIIGKEAVPLLRYVYGKNCKWEAKVYKIENLIKNRYITIYGGQDDVETMDQLYSIFNSKGGVNFALFSDRELLNANKIDAHNWISCKEFMKGEHKRFKRAATAHLIETLRSANHSAFAKSHLLEEISLSLYNDISELTEYLSKWYRKSSECTPIYNKLLEIATANNLFDQSIFDVYLRTKNRLQASRFINYQISVAGYSMHSECKKCMIDLFKYNKIRVNLNNYKLASVQEEEEEEN
jgi:hypothetical protein